MLELMLLIKAMADENRVRAMCALREQTLCVCQLVELLELAPSTVSKHMTILKHARLVEGHKQGRWMYYRLAGEKAPAAVRDAIEWLCRSASDNEIIVQDRHRLSDILKLDREELCRLQAAGDRLQAASCRPQPIVIK